MSDIAATESATTESAPASQTTADIAASVLNESESPTSGTDATTAAAGAENSVGEPGLEAKPAITEAELSAAAKFLLAKGHRARTTDGRDTWLKHKTVEGMLDGYLGEHRSAWETERGSLEGRLKQADGMLQQLRREVSGDPRAYLEDLATVFPQYRQFLDGPKPAAEQPKPAGPDMPQPDVPLPNGGHTYSVEGLQNLIKWAVDAQMMPKVNERLKPWEERDKAERERAQREDWQRGTDQRINDQMTAAQSWPMFGKLDPNTPLNDFQKEVLGEMQKDTDAAKAAGWNSNDPRTSHLRPTMTMRQAYLEVFARHQRTSILDEIKKAPPAPTVGRSGNEQPAAKAQSTADIARSVAAEYDRRR